MSQSGYTPLKIYSSTTAAATPAAGNLVNDASGSEIAINITDGKLFYKDNLGVVQVLASKAGNVNVSSFSGGTTGLTPAIATTGAVTLGGTLGVANGGTGLTSVTENRIPYGNGTSPLQTSANLTFDGTTFTTTGNAIISDNSANAALRITQVGTGNAILVEDSANPDSTPFVIANDGKVVIGATSSPVIEGFNRLFYMGTAGVGAQAVFQEYLNNSSGPQLWLSKTRGTTAGSKTIVQDGDEFGAIRFLGTDGTTDLAGANIRAFVDGTPGTNDMPGRLVFSTTADGASSPTERMRIDSAGRVGIGGTPSSSQKFLLTGNTTGAATVAAQLISNTFLSGVTFSGRGIWTSLSTQAAAFTLPDLTHYFASQGTIGADSTVTNQFGFTVSSGLTGATNNYGFYSGIDSGTGRWNFYAGGTAANVFAGTTSIGGTVGSESLRVTPVASAVNYVSVQGGATGNYVSVGASGSDTNIDLALTPKGTGNVKFGTFTTNADTAITGYITIKDSAGNVRKLAVIA